MKHSTLTMFRRVMAMSLALLLVVGLTGCFGKEDPDPTEDPTTAATAAPTDAPTEAPTDAPTEAPTEPPVKGVMGTVSANNLNVRSNPSTDSTVLSQLPVNLRVEILEQKTVGGTNWGRIGDMTLPNGNKASGGWLNLHYVKLDASEDQTGTDATTPTGGTTTVDPDEEALGTITAQQLQIRKGAGTTYDAAGSYKKGDRVKILEQKTVSGTTWGRTEKGWISMTYVKLDGSAGSATDTGTNVAQPGATTPTTGSSSGTGTGTSTDSGIEVSNNKTTVLGYVVVDVDGLTLRSGPSTKYKSLGTADEGDRYPYYQTSSGWYRTSHGWLSNADEAYLYIEGTTADDAGIAVIKAKEMYVRQGPGTNFKSVTTLKEGDSLVVLGRADGWGYTRLGWINIDTDYVTFTKGITYTTGSAEVIVDGLNVREGAGTDEKSVDSLDKGDKVTVTQIDSTDKSWGKITYGTSNKTGWINLSYVKMTSSTGSSGTTSTTKYNVTVVNTEGDVTVSNSKPASGTEVTVTATAPTGKILDKIEVKKTGGEDKVTVNGTKFTMPEYDVTVTVTFKTYVETFKVTIEAGEGGNVSAGADSFAKNATVSLNVTLETGWALDTLTWQYGTNTATDITSSKSFTMPEADVTVKATFKKKYSVTITTPTNGTVSASPTAACKDDTVTLTVTPNDGYERDTIKVNDNAITGTTFTMPEGNATVTATFKALATTKYKVGSNGVEVKPNAEGTGTTVATLAADTEIEVYGTPDTYAKILYNNKYHYVLASAITAVSGS